MEFLQQTEQVIQAVRSYSVSININVDYMTLQALQQNSNMVHGN